MRASEGRAVGCGEVEVVGGGMGYLTWHRDRRRCYRERLGAGRAIGSGQVEGACKNLIGARLKQTGARWSECRVNWMGVVCSLAYGDQWDDYWEQAE